MVRSHKKFVETWKLRLFIHANANYVLSTRYTESEGQLTEATLTIKKVRKEDFNATFSCFLENDRGYKIVNISLRQKAPRKGAVSFSFAFCFLFFKLDNYKWIVILILIIII